MTAQGDTCTCVAVLRAEAERLLAAADRSQRRGDTRNAEWARRAAYGCARAAGVLRRGQR